MVYSTRSASKAQQQQQHEPGSVGSDTSTSVSTSSSASLWQNGGSSLRQRSSARVTPPSTPPVHVSSGLPPARALLLGTLSTLAWMAFSSLLIILNKNLYQASARSTWPLPRCGMAMLLI